MIKVLPPKTAEEVMARERERKATTLLMALPEDHLAKLHKMANAKEIWKAIKSRFGGNDESKEMHKYLLKQQFDGTTASSLNTQNVAFMSADNTSSTNDVAMISMRIKKFHKRTGRKLQFDTKDPVGFDKTKVKCFNCHKIGNFTRDCRAKGNQDSQRRDAGYNRTKTRDNGRRPSYQDDSKALVTIDKEDINWSRHIEKDVQNYVMMAYSSSNLSSDNEVKSCSKTCEESYARLKKLYDEQRDKLGDASVEITAYTLALKKIEAQLLCHQQNQLAYEQKIRFMKIDLDDKTDVLAYHKKLLAEALKEKKDLKTKFKNWENVKESGTPNHSLKTEKHDRNGLTRKGLGYAFTRKACFVCGSFSHLIRDCVFYETRMAKQAELTKSKNKDDPYRALKDKGIVDSGCSRHMTRNK
nr:ribonuclease H-like domain-containing protein [Tanacetum cinerariifolium]